MLGELIKLLRKYPKSQVTNYGFTELYSWRGSYDELSCDYPQTAAIGDMLKLLQEATTRTFGGYKGGEFQMYDHTNIHIDPWGMYGAGTLTPALWKVILDMEKEANDRW